jgi:hypothetical protein
MKLTELKTHSTYFETGIPLAYKLRFTGDVSEPKNDGYNNFYRLAHFDLIPMPNFESLVKEYRPDGLWLTFWESDYRDGKYNNYENNFIKEEAI